MNTQPGDEIKFVTSLPEWWDERGRIAIFEGTLLIAHPEHPPMFLNKEDQFQELVAQ